jgi:hypothetical protein
VGRHAVQHVEQQRLQDGRKGPHGLEVEHLESLDGDRVLEVVEEPITVRAARRVGDILKCVAEGGKVQPTFRFFM